MGVYIRNIDITEIKRGAAAVINIDDILFLKTADDIVLIPDHGDLIDRDKLKHGFCVECTLYPDNCLGENCDWGSIYHIEHAPAVIPAERSEDGET